MEKFRKELPYENIASEKVSSEIAELEKKYGTIPNEETQAAIEELKSGKGDKVTINQIMEELNAGN